SQKHSIKISMEEVVYLGADLPGIKASIVLPEDKRPAGTSKNHLEKFRKKRNQGKELKVEKVKYHGSIMEKNSRYKASLENSSNFKYGNGKEKDAENDGSTTENLERKTGVEKNETYNLNSNSAEEMVYNEIRDDETQIGIGLKKDESDTSKCHQAHEMNHVKEIQVEKDEHETEGHKGEPKWKDPPDQLPNEVCAVVTTPIN
ncbi:20843_t:CDS:2, partial [Gigaspora rosea]